MKNAMTDAYMGTQDEFRRLIEGYEVERAKREEPCGIYIPKTGLHNNRKKKKRR